MKCVIKLSVIRKNLAAFNKPIAFMVKANAYGHGISIVESVEDRVTAYGVATEEEGAKLRALTKKPILITAPYYKNAALASKYALTCLVGDKKQIKALSDASRFAVAHLKVDSGMRRFGSTTVNDTVENCLYARSLGNVCIKGIATHFSSPQALAKESSRFDRHVSAAENVCGRLLRHASASSTALMTDYDMLRIGYSAYVGAMKVYSSVAAVKTLKKGDTVGYGEKYVADKPMKISVVYGGYADGIVRGCIGYEVTINGKKHAIVAVCMDVFIVEGGECKVGDDVIIIGGERDFRKMADLLDTIPYELYVGFTGRCKLTYEK